MKLPTVPRAHPYRDDIPLSPEVFSYHFIRRVKKSAPWVRVAYFELEAGDLSIAGAEAYFSTYGYTVTDFAFARIVDAEDWHHIQVRQHLRAVGY